MTKHIFDFISAHWQAIGGFSLYSIIALIATMPVPGEPVKIYDWMYAWLHALINSPGAGKFRPPAQSTIPNEVPKGDTKA